MLLPGVLPAGNAKGVNAQFLPLAGVYTTRKKCWLKVFLREKKRDFIFGFANCRSERFLQCTIQFRENSAVDARNLCVKNWIGAMFFAHFFGCLKKWTGECNKYFVNSLNLSLMGRKFLKTTFLNTEVRQARPIP